MDCGICEKRAVASGPPLCEEHFVESFEKRVYETIKDFNMIKTGDKVAVAVSGGKDSLTVLSLLKRLHGDVTAILIDEGIAGYRDLTIIDAKEFCENNGISLVIKRFKDKAGKTLDETLVDKGHPCSVCGKLRRLMLNETAQGFDVLATGHNADDETQAVMMNIIKGNTELFSRIGPVTDSGKGFVRRVKPLYFCTEKEVMTYSFLKGFAKTFIECPYAHESYRGIIRDELNNYANQEQRREILRRFLKMKEEMKSA